MSSLRNDVKIKDSLNFLIHNVCQMLPFFEEQTRSLPKAYRLVGNGPEQIQGMTKIAITMLKRGEDTSELDREIFNAFRALKNLNLPSDVKWQFEQDAAQEIYEYFTVKAFLPVLFHGEPHGRIYTPEELGITYQATLAGLGDVPGELYKLCRHHLIHNKMTPQEKLTLWERNYEISLQILEILEGFEDVPPRTINASRRFRYSFKYTVLFRVRDAVDKNEELILKWRERLEGHS